MRRTEELQNRRHILFQQLEMISLYKEDFVKELGESGLKSKIDEILDEINFCSKEIVKFETQKIKMNNIDPIKHFEEISENLKSLQSIIKEGVSDSDLIDLKNDLFKAEFLANKLKLELSMDTLQRDHPELSVRDVVVKLTPELRPDISPKLIPVLIQFIMEDWISRKTRKAA